MVGVPFSFADQIAESAEIKLEGAFDSRFGLPLHQFMNLARTCDVASNSAHAISKPIRAAQTTRGHSSISR